MPPPGGIVVSASGFSTAGVDGCRTKLWTSPIRAFADKHLVHVDEKLRSVDASFPQRLWKQLGKACG
jgi:hypothetical protein